MTARVPELPPPHVEERLRQRLQSVRPIPVRSVHRRMLFWGAVAWVVASVVRTLVLGGLPRLDLLATALAALGWTAVVFGATMRAGRTGLGLPVERLVTLAIATPVLFVGLAAVSLAPDARPLPAWGCFEACFTSGLVAFAALVGALYRRVPSASVARGALVGAAAGVAAAAIIQLACRQGDFTHVMVGHALPIVVFALLGAGLASRVVRL